MVWSIGRALCWTLVVAAYVVAVPSARASTPEVGADPAGAIEPSPSITTSGACPEGEALTAAIGALLPRGGLDALPSSALVEVADLGETYRATVRFKGRTWVRVYRDVARNCEQRARFAAVFIVLTLVPPELLVESAVTNPPPPPAPPAAPAPPPTVAIPAPAPAPHRSWVELAALLEAAPAVRDAPSLVAPGFELRAGRQLGFLTGVGAVGLEPRATFNLSGLEARQWRVPFDLGARARRPVGPTELGAEIGVYGAILHAEGVNPPMPKQATRLDVGGRLGLVARLGWPRARVAPVVGLHAIFVPRQYEIITTPAGTIGHTPSLWIGATIGFRTSFL
jgi:hypothetical protein